MRALGLIAAALTIHACGGQPALRNLPRPDPGAVAGVAAVGAALMTAADPKGAEARVKKGQQPDEDLRPVPSQQMPGDVLDRLDEAQRREADAGPADGGAYPNRPDR
jgi:hypothetical protein